MSSASSVDFQILRRCARNELVHQLETFSAGGRIDLFIEDSLMKPLDRIAGASLLREHGVDKIFRFEPSSAAPPWGGAADCRIYLIRPTPANSKYIADHVAAAERARSIDDRKSYIVLFWPRRLRVCEMIFEQQGVIDRATLGEFNPLFIPLDTDLLSLELPEFFSSSFLDGTNVWFKTVAQCLLQLQSVYDARFSNIYALGRASEQIMKLLLRLAEEGPSSELAMSSSSSKSSTSPFSYVFLFDRDLDYVSVFLSCLTYEALMDDVFSIQCGFTELPADISQQKDSTAKLLLSNETDPVYAKIRYRHFSCVMEELKWKVRDLQTLFDKRHHLEKVTEFKQFVANDLKSLKQNHRLLALHIGACESIMTKKSKENLEEQLRQEHTILAGVDYKESISCIEDYACQQLSEKTTLSLLCLLSLAQGGLSTKEYQNLRRQFLHAYGHNRLTTFFSLKKLGVLYERGGPAVPPGVPSVMQNVVSSIGSGNLSASVSGHSPIYFPGIFKKLNLRPEDDVDLKEQSRPSYVFNGAYTPAICEIVDRSLKRGFPKDELAKTFGRPAGMREAALSAAASAASATSASSTASPAIGRPLITSSRNREPPVILVCVLGGVTYAEMAALKWIGDQRGCRIVVATTQVINKEKFFKLLS